MIAAVLTALLIWWFSTGAIFWAVSRSGLNARWIVAMSAPIALLAAAFLVRSGGDTGHAGAYVGFLAAITVWGWFELAFLAGAITGPNRRECPAGARGWTRFRAAWGTVAHHELALLGAVVTLAILTWDDPNRTGLWTFLVLFFARISAKLNVYLGVPSFSDDLLPAAVGYLKSYFAQAPWNRLMPVSIALLGLLTLAWSRQAHLAADGSGAETGFVLLATLTVMALVEHVMMILPARDAVLWSWLAPKSAAGERPSGPIERSWR
jgi:putative photosynthetic complex assembly protein 2